MLIFEEYYKIESTLPLISICIYCFFLYLNMPFIIHPVYQIIEENNLVPRITEVSLFLLNLKNKYYNGCFTRLLLYILVFMLVMPNIDITSILDITGAISGMTIATIIPVIS